MMPTNHPLRELAAILWQIRELRAPVVRSQFEETNFQRADETAESCHESAIPMIEFESVEFDEFELFDSIEQMQQAGKAPASYDAFEFTGNEVGQVVETYNRNQVA